MNMQKLSRSVLSMLFTGLVLLPLAPAYSVTFRAKGSPQKTAGGATRGVCQHVGTSSPQPILTALIPATERELTAAAYPTVLVKISEPATRKAELTLWDEEGNGIYQTIVDLNATSGITSFKIPQAAEPLAVGKQYKWNLALICDPEERQRDIVLEGRLERVELSSALNSSLATASPLEKAKLYAQNGLWYDTVATLADLKRSLPQNTQIGAEWQELLQSVGLTELSQVPVVDCCQQPKN
ncbi:DUF928 domain-containing protein [Anabaena lutea]|uniref:DUF928 domain-containing protein n=1 Tax=Anabaena lutea FACHB-196 TaxID=2692881 RepID=A0ABR8FQK6_9NOST|nr:DUF928 domain-containing protein [Anabaena lutea]MBD2571016.1 DUF928 domain-containing protein [Anabaena lutea FACHB-196]